MILLDQPIVVVVTQVEYVHVILDTLAINVPHVLQDIIAVVVHAQVIVAICNNNVFIFIFLSFL